jgi:hypothetical protein
MLENIPLIKKDISLLNLFDTTSLIEEIVDERKKDEFYLTDAAKLGFIGKYLSSLRKLDHIIAPKEGFEAQL